MNVSFASRFCPAARFPRQALATLATEKTSRGHIRLKGPSSLPGRVASIASGCVHRYDGAAENWRARPSCIAAVACVTDYDVWHETGESVTVEMVVNNLRRWRTPSASFVE